jgi:hypothetical protein
MLQITDNARDAELIREVNLKYAELLGERYKDRTANHFQNIAAMANGFLGQRMVQSMLNQLHIPYLHDEMALKLVEDRVYGGDFILYDFNSEENASIEVKTGCYGNVAKPYEHMLVNLKDWDTNVREGSTPDIVVGLRLTSDGLNAEIMGWTEGCNIVKLSDAKAADMICYESSPCYAIPYNALHNFADLIPKLRRFSIDLEHFDNVISQMVT